MTGTTEGGTEDATGILGAVTSAIGSPTPVRLMPGGPVLITTPDDARDVLRDDHRFPIPFDASRHVIRGGPGNGPDAGRPAKATPPLSAAAVARGTSIFETELATVWPADATVDALRLLRRPVSRSTTAALVPQADVPDRDRIADLTLDWVDALAPVITAARPPRRWSRARRREQRALAGLRAALRAQGEVRDSALATALAAGVQVPIAGGAWVLCQLAAHPELARAAGADPGLAVAVVWETLRLYPPTWLLPRMPLEDCVVGGTPIAAYTPLVVSPRALGQLPDLVPGPAEGFAPLAEFDPSRWVGVAHRPGAWLPFGAGPHACPGRNLALAQLTHLVVRASAVSLSLPGPVQVNTSRGLSPSPALVRVTRPEQVRPAEPRVVSEVGPAPGGPYSGRDA